MSRVVATECATCGGDIGLWSPPNLEAGYTHMKPGGAADFEVNKHHDVVPTGFVPFPPSWTTTSSDEQITIPKLTAQVLFDALANSLDATSGFLDTEEVEALRALAVALGVDPNEGTPIEFSRLYPHPYQPFKDPSKADSALGIRRLVAVKTPDGWTTERNDEPRPFEPCNVGWPACAKPENDPIHQATEMGA